jgi:hypothetical protein
MQKPSFLALIFICLLVIIGSAMLNACASTAAFGQASSIDAQVNTAVAATMIQFMVETKVAAGSIAMASTPASQAQATQPPAPTPTPVPTEATQPAAATAEPAQPTASAPPSPTSPPPASGPKITADQNTNCRVGPSTGYAVQTYFVKGSVSTVEGKDAGLDWWYIASPDGGSEFCWVWEGSTTVQGDTSSVPVVAAPTGGATKPANPYNVWNVYNPYNFPYNCTNYYPSSCGKPSNCGKVVVCKPNQKYCNPYNWGVCNPNQQFCNPNYWGTCNPYVNCPCKPVYQNRCRQGGCPPVTEVNFKNYCKKYPQCCNQD